MSDSLDTRLAVHEAVCTERYNSIDRSLRDGEKRINKIEILLYVLLIAVLFGPGVAGEFVKKLLGI